MSSNRTKNRLGIFLSVAFGLAVLAGCESGQEPPRVVQPKKEPVVAKPEPAKPKITTRKADVGVGKKGRDYGQGLVATPAAAYFAVRENIAFRIQIPQALQLFKAEHDRLPKDHAEFMEVIIKANNIKLPELPDGDSYRYDPKTGELMVDHPE